MVVEVFVAQGHAEDPLAKQRFEVMGDLGGVTGGGDAVRQVRGQTELAFRLPKEQGCGVESQPPAVESGGDLLSPKAGKR